MILLLIRRYYTPQRYEQIYCCLMQINSRDGNTNRIKLNPDFQVKDAVTLEHYIHQPLLMGVTVYQ